MKKLCKAVINNLISIFSVKSTLCIIVVFVSTGYITMNLYSTPTVNDLIRYEFYGTSNIGEVPIELLKWTLLQMTLIFIILNFYSNELKKRITMTIIRIGSKKIWLSSIVITIFIYCLLYFLLGCLILVFTKPTLLTANIDYLELVMMVSLLALSGFSISMIGIIFTMFIESESLIILIMVFLYYLSISLGHLFINLDKFLIFNQGILAKHYNMNISFCWSYIYSSIIALTLYLYLVHVFLNRDI